MQAGNISSSRGLSFPVVLISGITAAFFILISFFVIRHINTRWSPTAKNAQELISKKKYAEALAVIEKAEKGREDPIFTNLHKIVKQHDGLWNAEAEEYLLENGPRI